MAEHRLTAEPTHSRWNRALEPRLTIASGDTVHMSCLDASGGQVTPARAWKIFWPSTGAGFMP
jgi:acetamidase/formamidase